MEIIQKRINSIIESRIMLAPLEFKSKFPQVLKGQINWLTILDDQSLILVFLDKIGIDRVKKLSSENYDSFPGLITYDSTQNAMVKLDNSINTYIANSSVSGIYSFCIGKDTTFIIQNHTQTINTDKLGIITYKIELAYGFSFGDKILFENIYDQIDELIAYSIKVWRSNK